MNVRIALFLGVVTILALSCKESQPAIDSAAVGGVKTDNRETVVERRVRLEQLQQAEFKKLAQTDPETAKLLAQRNKGKKESEHLVNEAISNDSPAGRDLIEKLAECRGKLERIETELAVASAGRLGELRAERHAVGAQIALLWKERMKLRKKVLDADMRLNVQLDIEKNKLQSINEELTKKLEKSGSAGVDLAKELGAVRKEMEAEKQQRLTPVAGK